MRYTAESKSKSGCHITETVGTIGQQVPTVAGSDLIQSNHQFQHTIAIEDGSTAPN